MTRILRVSLLLAAVLIASWATSSEACHRRRAHASATCGYAGYTDSGYTYASPAGYYDAGGGYAAAGGGYYGGYAGGMAGYPGGYGYGYDLGRPGYNPGGLGGPYSGLGVRPGLGFGARGWARAATTRAASAGLRPGWGCGPDWASAASAGDADHLQGLR